MTASSIPSVLDSASPSPELPAPADVAVAADQIRPWIVRTPVLRNEELDHKAGCALYFKCENLQRGGSFKLRGAMNAVWSLGHDEASRGVATHSSGNHGSALARAARSRGISCHVVVPDGAVATKLRNIEEQGALIHRCAATQAARESALAQIVSSSGAAPVHPYDDWRVILGQGTAARELLDEHPDLDAIVAPIGGGGLIGGTLLAARAHARPVRVFAAEPAGAADAALSLVRGARVLDVKPATIADGLRATIGVRNFALIASGVAEIWVVEDKAIIAAMRLLWERLKILVEPSSAIALAAILQCGRPQLRNLRVGVILTGGNVDLDALPWTASPS